jgi:hypothetical protein
MAEKLSTYKALIENHNGKGYFKDQDDDDGGGGGGGGDADDDIVFKHPVALLHFTHDNYFHHNATIYFFTLPLHNKFRTQSAIIRCSYFAKTVTLY